MEQYSIKTDILESLSKPPQPSKSYAQQRPTIKLLLLIRYPPCNDTLGKIMFNFRSSSPSEEKSLILCTSWDYVKRWPNAPSLSVSECKVLFCTSNMDISCISMGFGVLLFSESLHVLICIWNTYMLTINCLSDI